MRLAQCEWSCWFVTPVLSYTPTALSLSQDYKREISGPMVSTVWTQRACFEGLLS
jgi:hypothetical protein